MTITRRFQGRNDRLCGHRTLRIHLGIAGRASDENIVEVTPTPFSFLGPEEHLPPLGFRCTRSNGILAFYPYF